MMRATAGVIATVMTLALGGPVLGAGTVLQLSSGDRERITDLLGAGVVGDALPSDAVAEGMSRRLLN